MKQNLLTILSLATICSSQVALAKSQFDQLRSWAGKYPSCSIDKKTGATNTFKIGFFSVPEIRQRLIQVLNKKDCKLLTQDYGVETPIKLLGDYLCVKNCRPHNCGAENGSFAIDLRDGSIYVMMYLIDVNGKEHVRWFSSNQKYTRLPESVRNYMTDFSAE
jgi:hypothetical protein